ncbi:U3 small nucleolar RNA-associated protein 23, partial [Phenoliferia sp. Uapishka_3]
MRQKRVKSYRKVMQLYCSTFKFREPYQLLVDAEFCSSVVHQKLDFQARLEDVCQGAVKPMITQCCMQALYDLGAEGQGAVDLAKGFERRKCNHFKVRPQDECMTAMAGADNKNRYVMATQSLPLRQALRNVPGLPIIYLARSVVLLEAPSTKTLNKKKEMENEKLHVPAAELAFLTKTSAPSTNSSALIDAGLPFASTSTLPSTETPVAELEKDSKEGAPRKRKRKGPPGPNPLSIKKKKKEDGERGEKRPRVDLDAGRIGSVAARVTGEGKKRKRGRGKKTAAPGEQTDAGAGTAEAGDAGGSGGDDA